MPDPKSMQDLYKQYQDKGLRDFCDTISIDKVKIIKAFLIEFEKDIQQIVHLVPYLKKGLEEGYLQKNLYKKRAKEKNTQFLDKQQQPTFPSHKRLIKALKQQMEITGPYHRINPKTQKIQMNHTVHSDDMVCFFSFETEEKEKVASGILEYKDENFIPYIKRYISQLEIPYNPDILQLLRSLEPKD
jgi:hypothetical protein